MVEAPESRPVATAIIYGAGAGIYLPIIASVQPRAEVYIVKITTSIRRIRSIWPDKD